MRFSVLGYQKQLVSRGALPRATAAKVSEADRSTMNGNGEPAGQWKPCAACTQPLFVDPRGGHCCVRDSSTLGPPVWGGEGLLLPFVLVKERASGHIHFTPAAAIANMSHGRPQPSQLRPFIIIPRARRPPQSRQSPHPHPPLQPFGTS